MKRRLGENGNWTPSSANWCSRAFRVGLLGGLGALALASNASAQSQVELLEEFPMDQVTVDDPYYQQLFEVDVDYLFRLDPDRLMGGFRAESMNQTPAGFNLYGGWEGTWGSTDGYSLIRGHTLGHYLTALAQAYRQTLNTDPTLNQQIDDRLQYMVGELRSFQQQNGGGYLFATPENQFDIVENTVGPDISEAWVPWYTMHKVLSGLIDVAKLHGSPTALQTASDLGDWVYSRTSSWSDSTRSTVLGTEYGGMNDCMYELYKLTGDANHLAAAHAFDEDTLFQPISQGNDPLNGMHANTQIPKFIGSLNRFRVLGASEAFYFDTAEEFWSTVLGNHTYVTGGNSRLEHFREPGMLDANRDNTNNETCNSYNMMKLTRELFKITTDVKYADFYERAFINEILSAIHPETGMTSYFKSMGTGYFKVFGEETETFWCCNGSGMENYTKMSDGIYFHDEEDLYVNMYVSSTVDWAERMFSMHQVADVPLSPTVTFTVDSAPAEEVGIRFRKPWWLANGKLATLFVNDETQCVEADGGYFEVTRVWNAGDTISLTLPADVRVSRLPDNPNAMAFTYGPVVLSAGLGTEQMVAETQWASLKASAPPTPVDETVAVLSGTIEDWVGNIGQNLVQVPGELEFNLQGTDSDDRLTFTPHYLRYQDRYGIYFVFEGEQGTPAAPPDPANDTTDCEGVPPVGTGGTPGTGGAGVGGSAPTGGAAAGGAGSGGAPSGSGGAIVSTGGVPATTGGASPAGGSATGGVSAAPTGGGSPAGGPGAASDEPGGCGCSIPSKRSSPYPLLLGAALGLALRRRSRRRRAL